LIPSIPFSIQPSVNSKEAEQSAIAKENRRLKAIENYKKRMERRFERRHRKET
jgi:hypothetical protein